MLSCMPVQSLKDLLMIAGFHKHSHYQVHHKYIFLAAIAAAVVCSTLKNHFRFCSLMVYDSSISPSDSEHPSGNPAIDVQDNSKPRLSALHWLIFFIFFEDVACLRLRRCKLASLLIRLLANYIHNWRGEVLIAFSFPCDSSIFQVRNKSLIIKIKFIFTHFGSPCSTSVITDM